MNNKKNKPRIDKYTQDILYPADLYVCTHCTKDVLDKEFSTPEGDTIYYEDAIAYVTSYATLKGDKTNECVFVVVIKDELYDKKLYDKYEILNTLAHEAYHVAFEYAKYNHIPLTEDTNEVIANLVGWANKCITKTYDKK